MVDPERYRKDCTKEARNVEDRELLQDFITNLEGEETAKKALEHLDDDFEATAYFALVDPYDRREMWSMALNRNLDVNARITLEVEGETYHGVARKPAYEISSPESYRVNGVTDSQSFTD